MNERIKELADRMWRVHPSDIDAMGLKTRTEFYEHELKKFAELIVRECINAIQSDMDRETVNGTISLAKHAGMVSAKTVIKKHFGVEE